MTDDTSAPLDIKFQKRLVPNFISNILYFILNLIVGFALIPYFVDTLGYAAYGLIPLATSITSYVTMVIDAVNIPVSRYLSIALQKGDKEQSNITYNTVLLGTLKIVLILVPIAVIVAFVSPFLFNIGDVAVADVTIMFLFVIGSVLLRSWGSTFMATLFAYNRLDLRNYVNISNVALQIMLIIGFFTLLSPSLIYVGLAYFLAAIFALTLAIFFSKRTAKVLSLQSNLYSGRLFNEILGVAGWSLVDKFGCILNGTVALLVANVVLGEVLAADYSVALTVYNGLIAVGGLLTTLFAPKVYSHISLGDVTGLVNFCKSAIKCAGMFITLPVAIICLFTPEILTLWMGSDYTYLTPLIWIVIVPVLFWVCVAPIGSFGVAFLKVRVPAFSAVFTGGLNVILSVIFPTVFNMGVYGVALAGGISIWLHAAVICPIYYAHVTHVPWYTYTLNIHKSLLYFSGAIIFGGLCVFILQPASIVGLIITCGLICVIYVFLFPRLLLTSAEKEMVRSMIPSFIPKTLMRWIL